MRIVLRTLPIVVVAVVLAGCGSGDSEDVISAKQVVMKVPGMS